MIVSRIFADKGDQLAEYLGSFDSLLFIEVSGDGTVVDVNASAAHWTTDIGGLVGRRLVDVLVPGPEFGQVDILECTEPVGFTVLGSSRLFRGRTCRGQGGSYVVAELVVSGDNRVLSMLSQSNNELLGLMRQLRVKNRELEQANARIEELMLTDVLTGMANRRALEQRWVVECNRAERHGTPLCVAILDIDHFKSVNDNHGHLVGDSVLSAVAEVLTGGIRKVDMAARWGGEEFLMLLPETDLPGAKVLAERLRLGIAEKECCDGRVRVTASLGLAQFQKGDDVDSLVRRADEALYRAKRSGRNRTETWEP